MTTERIIWWFVLAWTMRYAWRAMRRAEKIDGSGTRVLEQGAGKIEDMIRLAGPKNLVSEGPAGVQWTTSVSVNGVAYKITMERRIWETE